MFTQQRTFGQPPQAQDHGHGTGTRVGSQPPPYAAGNGPLKPLSGLGQGAQAKKAKDDSDVPVHISQDHYRHIHEQRDFTLENLSMAGQTDLVDYEDLKISHEFDFE